MTTDTKYTKAYPVAKLVPYANNSRTHSQKQIAQVAASIKEFGFTNPVLIDEDGGIIAGHGRVLAAQSLEIKKVPAITLIGLSEVQKKAYVIADNQLALNADWDLDLLRSEVESLTGMDFDIDLLGFDEDQINELLDIDGPDDNPFSRKIKAPIYEITGDKPSLTSLIDSEKSTSLIEEINSSKLSSNEKLFLLAAAGRHTIFQFDKIAEYYAHSSEEMQNLMEKSALVVIDFDKAIEGGYVGLSEAILNQYSEDYPDEQK